MPSRLGRRSLGLLAALAATGLPASVHAAWPERQITLVVPFPAGGRA